MTPIDTSIFTDHAVVRFRVQSTATPPPVPHDFTRAAVYTFEAGGSVWVLTVDEHRDRNLDSGR